MLNTSTHKIISIVLILTSVLIINACAYSPVNNQTEDSSTASATLNDYELLLGSLLNEIDVEDFSYINQQGVKKFDQLKHFKALERLYISSVENKQENQKLATKQLKTLLFFSFYATEANSAALLEYLAADLLTVYKSQPVDFLKVLSKLPFLVKPNCNRLNAHFGFEGKNLLAKPSFLATNTDLIKQNLSKESAKVCLDEFE